MNCQDFKKQIMDLVLDELSEGSRPALEQHASQCAACGTEFNRLVTMGNVLKSGWRDVEVPAPLVFTPAPSPASSGFWSWLLAAPRWANVCLATGTALVFLFAIVSLTRVEFRYDHGQFALAFGQSRVAAPSRNNSSGPPLNAFLDAPEIEKLIAAKYTSLSAQDRERYGAMLEQLSQQVQTQRQADLQKIGLAFDQVKTVVWKDMQRNNAIVQYAAQRIVTNTRN
jgi:Putative zinc-finger